MNPKKAQLYSAEAPNDEQLAAAIEELGGDK